MSRATSSTKGNFVELSKDELKALEAVATDESRSREFVPATAIDPIFVERTYYLGPDKGGERAYRLLRDALEDAELVGVAVVLRARQAVHRDGAPVRGRPRDAPAALSGRGQAVERGPGRQAAEARRPPSSRLAQQIIEQLRHDTFDPDRSTTDEVKDRVRKLIAKKAKGGEIVAPPEAPKPVVTDLMEALKASLAGEAAADDRGRAGNGHAKSARANGHAKNGHAKNGHATHKRTSRVRPAAHRARASASSHRAHR